MLIAARAMKEAMVVLEPVLVGAGIKPESHAPSSARSRATSTTSARTSSGMMWKGANIEVIDLGVNVPPAKFVDGGQASTAPTSSACRPS